jgi:hypothetical protein
MPSDVEVMYCILGKPEFRRYMLKSLESLRLSGYEGPARVITDVDDDGWDRRGVLDYGVSQIRAGTDCERFGGKTVIDQYARAERTLVLDCDTVVLAPLDELWGELEYAEVALCPDIFPTVWQAAVNDLKHKPFNNQADIKETIDVCGTDAAYFNSGVLAFRRCGTTRRLFRTWHAEWAKHKRSNQYALVRAMQHEGVAPRVLPGQYNANAWNYGDRVTAQERGARILHFFCGPQAMFNY